MVLEVPSDGVGAAVKPFGDELSADLDDPLDNSRRDRGRGGLGSSRPWLERRVALGAVAGNEFGDPALGDPVSASDVGLGSALEYDSGDHQTCFGHPQQSSPRPSTVSDVSRHRFLCLERPVSYVLTEHTVVRSKNSCSACLLRAAGSRVLPTCPRNCPRCEACSMNGSIRQRSAGSWELRAYVGVDPATGRRLDRSITVRGNRSDAERELAEMVARVRCVSGCRVALDDE